jgi:hypothetical protein
MFFFRLKFGSWCFIFCHFPECTIALVFRMPMAHTGKVRRLISDTYASLLALVIENVITYHSLFDNELLFLTSCFIWQCYCSAS